MNDTIHAGHRRTRSKRVLTLVISYLLVAVCCLAHFASESIAEEGKGDKGAQKESWRYVGSSVIDTGGGTTRITVSGAGVLVPATVVHQGYEADVMLLLDTGAERTTISTEVADRLNINPAETKKARAQVVGGAIIEVRRLRLTSLTVGPHTKKEADVIIVPHRGPPVKYDGLLGMDLLRGLKYRIDFEKQIILWE